AGPAAATADSGSAWRVAPTPWPAGGGLRPGPGANRRSPGGCLGAGGTGATPPGADTPPLPTTAPPSPPPASRSAQRAHEPDDLPGFLLREHCRDEGRH